MPKPSSLIESLKKCIRLIQKGNLKVQRWKVLMIFRINTILLSRIWFWFEPQICKDLLLCNNLWQNHQGQGSKVCGHVVSYWRHNGTPNWVLHHQWNGDCLLWNQDHPQNAQGWTKTNEAHCLKENEIFKNLLLSALLMFSPM